MCGATNFRDTLQVMQQNQFRSLAVLSLIFPLGGFRSEMTCLELELGEKINNYKETQMTPRICTSVDLFI